MKKVKLVVFDLDGTIIDSEWAHEAAKTAISQSLGATGQMDLAAYTGRSNRVFWQNVLQSIQKDGDVDKLVQAQFLQVVKMLKEAAQPEAPGLTDLLRFLKSNGVLVGVSSGSEQYFIKDILDYLQITQYFDFIVTGNDIVELKPAPDIYLAALRISQIPPEFSVAVEDSSAGCQAARSAGLLCVGYTDGGKNPQQLEAADYRVDRLTKIKELFEYGS